MEYDCSEFKPIKTAVDNIEFNTYYDFKVILRIETEKDGTWKKGSFYRIEIYVQVNYINFNIYPFFNFTRPRIFSANADIRPYYLVNISLSYRIPLSWENPLWLGEFVAEAKKAGKAELRVELDYGGTYTHVWTNFGKEVVITIIEEAFALTPIVYTSIGTIIGAIAGVISTATYFKFKTHKLSQKHLKT